MVVQHNMQAINANRMLNVTTGQQAKSTEKLSSGYKINRAADDAAGLSISEKMRRQIRGLDRASTNASDGVSAVQTAEGALNEVHDMLQRMNELATQAANGTNSQTDRESIQNEIDQLTTEIDRVSETTKFNETMLLKGGDGKKDVLMNAHDAGLKGTLVDAKDGNATFSTELKVGDSVSIGGKSYTLKADDGKVSNNIKDISKDIKNLDTGDKVVIKNGSSVKGYQISDNLSAVSLNSGADSFSGVQNRGSGTISDVNGITGTAASTTAAGIQQAGNKVAIEYTDSEGVSQTFEMMYTGSQWEKVTGYNSKTGDPNTSGINLYNTDGTVKDDELKDVFRTATKLTATQAVSGETITYGSKSVIEDAVNNDAKVGSEVYMSSDTGVSGATSFAQIYGAAQANLSNLDSQNSLGQKATVRETSDVEVGDDNTITIHDAKKLMAQQLKTANEIGVDDKDSVTAAFRKSGSDIAQELDLNVEDQVTIKKADKDGNDTNTFYTIKSDLKEAVGQTFGNLTSAAGNAGSATRTGTAPAASTNTATIPGVNARINISYSDGSTVELKATGTGSWQRVDDDSTLTSTDIDNIMKDAVGIDYMEDTSSPEAADNVTVRWRTAEGMKADISQLDSGNKVKVEKQYGSSGYDTGDIEVKNDANAASNFDMKIGTVEVDKALNFNLHVGADADLNNKIGVNIETMNSKYLGIHGLDVVGKDANGVNTDDGGMAATYAIDSIEDAIQKVNEQRSALGAVQNRLEHTINNLDNVVENTTSAESRIRDTDIADEMVKYSKNNILAQAGQSMLAQANQSTQGALSLLG